MDKNRKLIALAGFFTLLLFITYSNHFDNGFYFDDAHTIVSNEYIRDLANLPEFFTNAETFSSLPANRAYRPLVTTIDAFNYWLAGGELNSKFFHYTMFFFYLAQLVLMYFFFLEILNLARSHRWNTYFSLFGTAWYALHTCNAETINYLISISDSFSTFAIVLTFVLYQSKKLRKYFVYFAGVLLAIYTKQTGAMVAPLLLLYIFLFDENLSLKEIFTFSEKKRILSGLKKSIPVFVICVLLFYFNQMMFTPESTVSSDMSVSKLDYFVTQFYIICYYLGNFILPVNLSADPDFIIITDYTDPRIIFGAFVLLLMLVTAYWSSLRSKTRPIAFGILWFFIALLPTSSFVPLFQIANDHRTFFPFVGLVLSVTSFIGLAFIKYEKQYLESNLAPKVIPLAFVLLIGAYAYGTHQRNEVWGNAHNLWKDVTYKSPKNGRGLMNYGNVLMGEGDYDGAEYYFTEALKYNPYYSYLHVNFGVLKNAKGETEEAEKYFKNGLSYDKTNPAVYQFYGKFLFNNGRIDEARILLEKGVEVSPKHTGIRALYNQVLNINTTEDESSLISQSLAYYNSGQYEKCIETCRKILKLNPKSSTAYNNICAASNQLKLWEQGAEACRKSLEIVDSELAKNNLAWAEQNLNK